MLELPHQEPSQEGGDGRPWSARRLLAPDAAMVRRLLLGFVIGTAGSTAFVLLKMPLPIFLGALTFCLVAAVLKAPVERPKFLSVPMRSILGVAVGTAFSPELFGRLPQMAPSLVLIVPYTALIVALGMVYFQRFAGFNRPTAFFCSVPGGLTDMISMASDAGANSRAVTLIHATRIVIIVFLLPVWLRMNEGIEVGGRIANVVHIWDLPLIDGAILVVLAWVGVWAARRLGIAGAPLVGPMVLSGIVHAIGLTDARVPFEALAVAQVTLGILLGCQFRGVTLKEFTGTLSWGLLFSVFLMALTVAVTLAISRMTGFDSVSVLLAFAPGGQNELNLLAFILGLDVAFIAIHHLVRLAVVMAGAQVVFARSKDWRRGPDDQGGL